jgi:hypothetical protein
VRFKTFPSFFFLFLFFVFVFIITLEIHVSSYVVAFYVDMVVHTDVKMLLMNSGSVDEHMYLLLPALVRLFRPDVSNAPLDIRRAAIKTLGRLLPCVQVIRCS